MRRGPSDKSILVHKNPRRVKTTLYFSEKTTQTLVQKYIVNDSKNKKYLTSLTKWRIRKKIFILFLNFENRFFLKAIVSFFRFSTLLRNYQYFFRGGGRASMAESKVMFPTMVYLGIFTLTHILMYFYQMGKSRLNQNKLQYLIRKYYLKKSFILSGAFLADILHSPLNL